MNGSDIILPAAATVQRRHWIKAPGRRRERDALPAVLAQSGALELRLAITKAEVRAVQRLRYQVFYEEGDAYADAATAGAGRDKCAFDRICDHLFVLDTAIERGPPAVVGTYRLLRGEVAAAEDGFYSATAFDLRPLLAHRPALRILELGRSCVHPAFRARRVIDLLWQGIGRYAAHHGIDTLIGCSSLPATHPEALALPLSFAFHHAALPPALQVRAVPARAARMDWLDRDSFDRRQAMAALPPLMKAYVRAGGAFASEAAIDLAFGTTDLFTLLPLAEAAPRYLAQFGPALAQLA